MFIRLEHLYSYQYLQKYEFQSHILLSAKVIRIWYTTATCIDY